MPVSSENSISGPYTPNGVAKDFAFDFKATAANEVIATDQNGVTISTALYSVTLDEDEGGTLSFDVAPQLSQYSQIYVVGDPALTQPSDFDNAGPSFNPAALTRALDRAAARDLKQQREIDRALKAPFGEIGPSLPPLSYRTGKFAVWDEAGNFTAVSGAIAVPALASNIAITGGGNVQQIVDAIDVVSLPSRGPSTGDANNERSNQAIGFHTLLSNTFVKNGYAAGGGFFYDQGSWNIAIGDYALEDNTTGHRNIAIGREALKDVTSGMYNIGIGVWAGWKLTTGIRNVFLGTQVGQNATTGNDNVGVGTSVLNQLTTASFNVGVGHLALNMVTTGDSNTAVGRQAGLNIGAGSENAIFGFQAGSQITSGKWNCAYGAAALASATTADGNSAFGRRALLAATGAENAAFGSDAGVSITSGKWNAAFGANALQAVTTTDSSSAFGRRALLSATGAENTAFGSDAGVSATTASRCTFIGYNAGSNVTTAFNTTCIGNGAVASAAGANNEFTLGNSSVATLRCQVTSITALSDRRFKQKIKPLGLGLAFIDDVDVRRFEWNGRGGTNKGQNDVGVIAQELHAVAEKHGAHWMNMVRTDNAERWEATPGLLLFPTVVAVQELSARLASVEQRLAA